MLTEPLKKCACGREYDAPGWAQLRERGVVWSDDSSERVRLELRDCLCGSTIAIEIEAPPPFRLERSATPSEALAELELIRRETEERFRALQAESPVERLVGTPRIARRLSALAKAADLVRDGGADRGGA